VPGSSQYRYLMPRLFAGAEQSGDDGDAVDILGRGGAASRPRGQHILKHPGKRAHPGLMRPFQWTIIGVRMPPS
jgi:hypothetical protein